MVRVLFVCLGNICRSPMAEAIFRDLVKSEGLEGKVLVDSAGTGHWHVGKPPHEGTRKILERNRISYEGMSGRQVTESDLSKFDFIIAMDSDNLDNLHKLGRTPTAGKITRLLDFVPEESVEDVPDPYFTGNFEEVFKLVTQGCQHLLAEVKEKVKGEEVDDGTTK